MKIRTNLSAVHHAMLGSETSEGNTDTEKYEWSKDFVTTLNDWCDEKILENISEQQKQETMEVFKFFEKQVFPSEGEKEVFEDMIERASKLFLSIKEKRKSFVHGRHDEKKVLTYMTRMLNDIRDHEAHQHFPRFETFSECIKEAATIGELETKIDQRYPLIDLKSWIDKRVNIFKTAQHVQQYCSLYMIYSIIDAALGVYLYDRGVEGQIDQYIAQEEMETANPYNMDEQEQLATQKRIRDKIADMERQEKKQLVETKVRKSLKQFAKRYTDTDRHGAKNPIQLNKRIFKGDISESTIKINTHFRFKTEESKMRKSLTKNEYYNNIYDSTGTQFLIELPELEEYIAAKEAAASTPTEQQRVAAMKEHLRQHKYKIIQDLFGYLPNLLGTTSFRKDRTRVYMTAGTRRPESSENYQAIHATANEFKVDNYTFQITNEIQIIPNWWSHTTLRKNDYKKLAKNYQQGVLGETLLRKKAKYVIVGDNKDYIGNTAFDPYLIDPRKAGDPDYREKVGKEFRRTNAQLLVDTYIDCHKDYFEKLFEFDDDPASIEQFKYKVSGLKDEEITKRRPGKKSYIRGQVTKFAKKILKNEIEYVIKPLKEKLEKRIFSFEKEQSKQTADVALTATEIEEMIADAKRRLQTVQNYEKKIKHHYKLTG